MTTRYMHGFGNEFESEALPGALPQGQNSPQRCPYGLYAEQISGTAFTAPRGANARSWLYRIRPSVRHVGRFARFELSDWKTAPHVAAHGLPLGPLRWGPPSPPSEPSTFLTGMRTMTTAGDVNAQAGMAAHIYFASESMTDDYFYNADGEMLIAPQIGMLDLATELGRMAVGPGEIAVMPRGLKFKVGLADGPSRGYVCENYGARFTLPERGPIGANCLANRRDFKSPVAWFEDKESPCRLTVKWCGEFHRAEIAHSPLDVVAWHGNYAPYKYDLRTFAPVGALLIDHPDPSIYTVLSAPSGEAGVANVDFVIFPERWLVAEHSFRPPWYHVNIMSEFMGLIYGQYDAKAQGFAPGGISLHNCMLPHGPDKEAFDKASSAELHPHKLTDTLAFMFETRYPQHVTNYAASLPTLQHDYIECWRGLEKHFDPTRRDWTGP
ncbi:homogentisate 1,2-dioxygenase [Methylocapsa acidiphila]|uniref:homogentisate 1,2-dioxygenase n=1 Tax=Methylocapsa acidiphila TaxID=133552 RepID=UPI0003F59EC4|nr:homogentisate 1,2-dioxygenase [Methylocapsa acidiphila]